MVAELSLTTRYRALEEAMLLVQAESPEELIRAVGISRGPSGVSVGTVNRGRDWPITDTQARAAHESNHLKHGDAAD